MARVVPTPPAPSMPTWGRPRPQPCVPRTGVLLLHSFLRMVMRMVTFLQERPSSLPGGTRWWRRLWLRSAPGAVGWARLGQLVSCWRVPPPALVSMHWSPSPSEGKPFTSVPRKWVEEGKAGEVEEGVWDSLGAPEKDLGTGRLPPHPSLNVCL